LIYFHVKRNGQLDSRFIAYPGTASFYVLDQLLRKAGSFRQFFLRYSLYVTVFLDICGKHPSQTVSFHRYIPHNFKIMGFAWHLTNRFYQSSVVIINIW
jgi:hypothetical protein